jgi:CheY-like chemotaxis protein
MNGIEAMQILNQDPLTSHIPIVALSANAMPLDVATGLTAGFYKYLTKPINVSAFMETLTFSLEYAAKRRRSLTSTSTIEPLAVLI